MSGTLDREIKYGNTVTLFTLQCLPEGEKHFLGSVEFPRFKFHCLFSLPSRGTVFLKNKRKKATKL